MKALPLPKDPERLLQERFNPFTWLVFHSLALWSAVSYWLRFKRVCAWHEPKHLRMGGNPFAKQVTHGICPACFRRVTGEIVSHKNYLGGARPVVIKHPHQISPSLKTNQQTYEQKQNQNQTPANFHAR